MLDEAPVRSEKSSAFFLARNKRPVRERDRVPPFFQFHCLAHRSGVPRPSHLSNALSNPSPRILSPPVGTSLPSLLISLVRISLKSSLCTLCCGLEFLLNLSTPVHLDQVCIPAVLASSSLLSNTRLSPPRSPTPGDGLVLALLSAEDVS